MGAEEPQEYFSCQTFIDGDCRVTWGVVVVQHPVAFNAWSRTCHLFPESFNEFLITFNWQFVLVSQILCGLSPDCKKKTNGHRFDFGFAHSRFLVTERLCSLPLPTLAFCFWKHLDAHISHVQILC